MKFLSVPHSFIFNFLVSIFPKKEKTIFFWPNYFCYFAVIIFVVMFQSGEASPFNLIKNSLLGMAFLVWLTGCIYSGSFKKIGFGFIEYFLVFTFFVLLSAFNAVDEKAIFFDFAKWMRLPLIYLLIINNIKSKEQLRDFLLMLGYFIGVAL